MMNQLEMITAREQLMEDIDAIVDEYFQEYGITNDPELVKVLCDAVCKNFPTNWHFPPCHSKLQSQKQMFLQFVLKPKKKQGNLWTNLITIFVIGNVLKTKLYWTKPHFPMRIFLSAIVVILGVNLLIDLMDSNLVDVMKERNETIQRQIDQMWRSDRCPLFWHGGPFPCILEEWRGFHFTNVLHFFFHA